MQVEAFHAHCWINTDDEWLPPFQAMYVSRGMASPMDHRSGHAHRAAGCSFSTVWPVRAGRRAGVKS